CFVFACRFTVAVVTGEGSSGDLATGFLYLSSYRYSLVNNMTLIGSNSSSHNFAIGAIDNLKIHHNSFKIPPPSPILIGDRFDDVERKHKMLLAGAHKDVERDGTIDMDTIVRFNEKVVHENRFQDGNGRKDDHVGLTSHDWAVSDVGLQAVEENEKESVKTSKQDGNDKIWETISKDDENKQKQTLGHSEKILHEECMQGVDKIKTEEGPDEEVMKNKEKLCTRDDNLQTLTRVGSNEKIEAVHEIDCSFDDNKVSDAKIEESGKRDAVVSENEESIKWDEDSDERLNSNKENKSVTLENSVASDMVYQVNDNEISQVHIDV
nr:hypothetical protein [Tanacetum cinerariifolium]GEZ79013.1 hypothetical protein [Tanacetum cinerariifolium]